MKRELDRNSFVKLILLFVTAFVVCVTIGTVAICITHTRLSKEPVAIELSSIEVSEVGAPVPRGSNILTREEFESYAKTSEAFNYTTYEEYYADAGANVNIVDSVTVGEANKKLYDITSENFNVYLNNVRISPLLPMAIANVETPSRADHKITWSALFPSKYVPAEKMETFNVCDVANDFDLLVPLSAEVSTRDRGALQMSPTYGTNNASINETMSGTESDKLKESGYLAGASRWVSGASTSPGDRFYLPDVCKRMQAAMQGQVDNMYRNNYIPKTDLQLIAMCGMGHHSSGVWYHKDKDKQVGKWKSGQLAYEYACKIGDDGFIKYLDGFVSIENRYTIDSNDAKGFYTAYYGSSDFDKYCTSEIVCTYPIKVMYSYLRLKQSYNGE